MIQLIVCYNIKLTNREQKSVSLRKKKPREKLYSFPWMDKKEETLKIYQKKYDNKIEQHKRIESNQNILISLIGLLFLRFFCSVLFLNRPF